MNIALIGSIGLQLLSLGVPQLRSLLSLTTISITDSVLVSGSAFLPLIFNETRKKLIAGKNV
ncbi:cation transporting ATPase C-terminal domain-containing protein [Rivularia sp. UHCC 0363]|uniref:cation transporting ATPase C-terminal domain-containing protein n=1 Tax=Rivularia sp. UHCC 0363 TaxID=3110244 RepID=UPI002B1ED2CF|nr:cation transporting ATPase C-terminal domain-containing protein [Rivularia sp. UHCC 0363]MEA5597132.1 cation transporting ATPase C-terminal domain-containing protein [Rivularia sp. UHCC 0363]